MVKKILVILLVLILIIIIRILSNPIVKSEEKIEEYLLKSIPYGSSMEDVISYLEKNREWEIRYINEDRGVLYRGKKSKYYVNSSRDPVIGVKSINIFMGEYILTSVEVFFAFDEDSKLIEIWVSKMTDVP